MNGLAMFPEAWRVLDRLDLMVLEILLAITDGGETLMLSYELSPFSATA